MACPKLLGNMSRVLWKSRARIPVSSQYARATVVPSMMVKEEQLSWSLCSLVVINRCVQLMRRGPHGDTPPRLLSFSRPPLLRPEIAQEPHTPALPKTSDARPQGLLDGRIDMR